VIGKQLTQETFNQRRAPRKQLASHDDPDFQQDKVPKFGRVVIPGLRRNYRVNNQLSDPETANRHNSSSQPQEDNRDCIKGLDLPDQLYQRGDVTQ